MGRWLKLLWEGLNSGVALRQRGAGSEMTFLRAVAAMIFNPETRSSARLWRARTLKCYRCPIFDRRRLTCGTAGDGATNAAGDWVALGCYCVMPLLKCWFKAANCWSREQGSDQGWPDELNGSLKFSTKPPIVKPP